MNNNEETIKSNWDLRTCFEQMRMDKGTHLGLGDIRLTIGMQEEICELVHRNQHKRLIQAQQQLIELLWVQVVDLTMMSKIELGDDVIAEGQRLRKIIDDEQYR